MARTSTERMRAKRERETKERKTLEDSTYPYLQNRFEKCEFSDFDLPLALAGFEPPDFSDGRDPKEFALEGTTGLEDPFPGAKGAVGRAEVIVDCLLDAAKELAQIINRYKREEVKTRLAEIETSETIDRTTAINEAIKLNKILDLLNKRDRQDLPRWKVTGV